MIESSIMFSRQRSDINVTEQLRIYYVFVKIYAKQKTELPAPLLLLVSDFLFLTLSSAVIPVEFLFSPFLSAIILSHLYH